MNNQMVLIIAVVFFFIVSSPGINLFAENGVQKVKFINQTKALGFDDKYHNWGVAFLDINKDRYYDIYVNNHGLHRAVIYINLEGKKFQKIDSAQFGIKEDDEHGVAAADINNDGWTDIYQVVGGAIGLGKGKRHNFLYIYDQPQKKFRDMSLLLMEQDPFGRGRGASVVDYSNDGLPDIFVSNGPSPFNEFSTNKFYKQMPNGKFIEVSKKVRLSFPTWSPFLWRDFNKDGYQDLYLIAKNSIYWNIAGDHFSSGANLPIKVNPLSRKVIFDVENDGFFDILYFDQRYPISEDSCFIDEDGDLLIHMEMRRDDGDVDKVRVHTGTKFVEIRFLINSNFMKATKDRPINPGLKLYLGKEKTLEINRYPWTRPISLANIIPGTPSMDGDGMYIFFDESGYLNIVGRGRKVNNVTEIFDLILRSTRPFTVLKTQDFESKLQVNNKPIYSYLKNFGGKKFVLNKLHIEGNHDALFGIINGTAGDFNNDGFIDIFLVGAKLYEGNDFLLLNDGHGGFLFNPLPDYFSRRAIKEAYVLDINNDGLLDVFIADELKIKGQHTVLMNITETGNKWIEIILQGSGKTASDAMGTRVELYTPQGVQVQEVGEMIRYNMSILPLHFGLGKAGIVYKVLVYWNSGVKEIKGTTLKINSRNLIKE
jgi:hypothetical protein